MRFIKERQKQSSADSCQKNTGYNDFVIAYANFGSTMKGMDGCEYSYRRLMIRLSKRVPVVMTDSKTKKACPVCKKHDLKMKFPKGNATY